MTTAANTKKPALVPSPAQAAIYRWVETGEGSAVIEAVAGAGKTTTLVGAVERMQGSVAMCAYNQKMGAELKERVAHLKNVRAGTFHSVGFGALRYFLKSVEVDKSGKKVRNIAARIVAGTAAEGWEPAIDQLVSMAMQMGFGVRGLVERPTMQDWLHQVERHEINQKLPEGADLGNFVRLAMRTLEEAFQQRDIVSFDDMIYMPLRLNLRFFKNDWVLVDEAQDTNPTRREMARRMLAPTGRLIAVGDPRQAIFGFTGADADSLDLIREEFSAITLPLTVTYRCPKAVVRAAREYVTHIEAAATAPEGEHQEMTRAEMLMLARPGDAILCRYNKYLVSLCFRLIREGRSAKIEGRSIGEGLAALAGRWKVKTLDALRTRLETHFAKEFERARLREDESKLEMLEDQRDTMAVLVDRGAEQGVTTVAGLQSMIRDMFEDVGNSRSLIVLSSVHRSKGLEWPRVFVYGRREFMPSPRAKQAWSQHQEINLIYVALTRAQQTLVDVTHTEEPDAKPARAEEGA